MSEEEAVTQTQVDEELHACARYGELDDLRLMCEGDDTGPMVNYNHLDAAGSTALHKAAANGHVDIMKYLVSRGAKYIENNIGAGPLMWAVLNKQTEAVAYLLEQFTTQIDVLKKPETGMSLLSTAYDTDNQDVRQQSTFIALAFYFISLCIACRPMLSLTLTLPFSRSSLLFGLCLSPDAGHHYAAEARLRQGPRLDAPGGGRPQRRAR